MKREIVINKMEAGQNNDWEGVGGEKVDLSRMIASR